jgi:hypothetical protein
MIPIHVSILSACILSILVTSACTSTSSCMTPLKEGSFDKKLQSEWSHGSQGFRYRFFLWRTNASGSGMAYINQVFSGTGFEGRLRLLEEREEGTTTWRLIHTIGSSQSDLLFLAKTKSMGHFVAIAAEIQLPKIRSARIIAQDVKQLNLDLSRFAKGYNLINSSPLRVDSELGLIWLGTGWGLRIQND